MRGMGVGAKEEKSLDKMVKKRKEQETTCFVFCILSTKNKKRMIKKRGPTR